MSVWNRAKRSAQPRSESTCRLRIEALEPRTVLAAPYALNDTFETDQDTPLVIETSALFANDFDFERDQLSAAIFLDRGPYSGTLTIQDEDTLFYRPHAGFFGEDYFNYFVSDDTSHGGAQVRITVKQVVPPGGGTGGVIGGVIIWNPTIGPCSVLRAGAANNDCYATSEDKPLVVAAPGVLGNDFTGDAGNLALQVQTQPAHGTVSLDADGGFSYVPAQDYFGSDQFAYELSGADGVIRSATVYIEVSAVNDPPIVNNDELTGESGLPLKIHINDLQANDRDVDNPMGVILLVPLHTAPQHGSLAIANTNIIYTPDLDYLGTDDFTYFATDGELFSAGSATVSIELTAAVRHNSLLPADVNLDAQISPLDALLIINYLNAYGSKPVAQAAQASRELLDVNGDGFIAPSDVLAVIDELNARRPTAASSHAPAVSIAPDQEQPVGESSSTSEALASIADASFLRRQGRRGR